MRDWLAIIVGIVLISAVFTYEAIANENNDVIKSCLKQTGYTPETFDTFSFAKAAGCYSDWKVGNNKVKYNQQKEFLEQNPWYKGSNWKWEERAEYRCERIYSNQMMANITVCSKPFYIN